MPVTVRLALEQADGSTFRFDTRVLPAAHPHAAANATHLERFVKFLLWSRGGWRMFVDGPPTLVAELAAHYRDTATGRFDASPRRRADVRSSARGRAHARPAGGALRDAAARPPSRRLPHRLRSRRQRSQGGGGDRRPRRLQRRDGVGPVPQAGSAVSLRRHHGFAGEGRRAPAARRRHRRQRRRRLRQQPGQGRLALSRRAEGPVRRAREGPVPRDPPRPGTTCRSRW